MTYLDQVPLDPDRKRWLDEFHNHAINSTLHAFYTAPTPWQQIIKDFYQPYFTQHSITVHFGIMKNTQARTGCLPPHADRVRSLAINYYLQLGGSAVRTVFYDRCVETKKHEATNLLYSQLQNTVCQTTFDNNWYAYDVDRVHSVENINDCRYILVITVDNQNNQYQLDDLIADYPNLIDSISVPTK
jgi:hypothetical protein